MAKGPFQEAAVGRGVRASADDTQPFHLLDLEPSSTITVGDDAGGVVREVGYDRNLMPVRNPGPAKLKKARAGGPHLGPEVVAEDRDLQA
jgi:hypothetical protein